MCHVTRLTCDSNSASHGEGRVTVEAERQRKGNAPFAGVHAPHICAFCSF